MAGDGLQFRLSGAGTDEASQPDIALSLGDWRASSADTLHDFQSTLTTAQAAGNRHIIRDTARVGDGANLHRGKYLSAVTGPAADVLFVARIIASGPQGADGVIVLAEPAPASMGVGEYYRATPALRLFADVTFEESRAGLVDYKCIFFQNSSGVNFNDAKYYLVPINPAGTTMEFVSGNSNTRVTRILADRYEDPTDQWGKVDPDPGANFHDFFPFSSTHSGYPLPTNAIVVNNTAAQPLYIRRTIPAGTFQRTSVVWALVAVSSVTGNDPDPLAVVQPIVFDVDGEDPTLAMVVDRHVYINGGARLEATVTEATLGTPIEGRAVEFSKVGDGTIIGQGYDRVTDEDGKVAASYRSPLNPALEGDPLTFTASVGGGVEV
jgi:hypothetical protein